MSKADYQVFASDLEAFHLLDIEAALNEIAEKPRRDGEPAIPDMGTLRYVIERHARLRAVSVAYHVWLCVTCGKTQAGANVAPCHSCKGKEMKRLTRHETPLSEYHAELEQYPERFVRIGDIFREAQRNVAERR